MATSASKYNLPRVGLSSSSTSWILAILFFGVLDVAVTIVGLHGYTTESHFAYLAVLDLFAFLRPYGFFLQLVATLTIWKAAAIVALFGLYRVAPREYRIGVPIGLAAWGAVVLVWNLHAIGLY